MDNVQFGVFVTQLRKERGLTQKELADRLCVTDKAVSKWETGKGFPDIKLLEPLARELDVSLVELIQGERQQTDHLTIAEAEHVVSQAMDQSQKITARRYLRLLKWLLVIIGIAAAYLPVINLSSFVAFCYYLGGIPGFTPNIGIIGGADGPTSMLVSTVPSPLPPWFWPVILAILSALCLSLSFRVHSLEKKLK